MLDKRALRREIAAQKRALSPAQIEAASADLTAQLLAHPLFRAARLILSILFDDSLNFFPVASAITFFIS